MGRGENSERDAPVTSLRAVALNSQLFTLNFYREDRHSGGAAGSASHINRAWVLFGMDRSRCSKHWLGAALLVAALGSLLWIESEKSRSLDVGQRPAFAETRQILLRNDSRLDVVDRAGESFTISLTRCSVRGLDGSRRSQNLTPAATPSTLAARLVALDALPIADSRDGETSRLVTRDLIVRLDGTETALLAENPGLALKSRPTHAPGWIILRAADPFAALAALPRLRTAPGVVEATVALARQQIPRTLPNDPLISSQWHLKSSGSASPGIDVNVESVWNFPGTGTRGSGICIGIVDDGLQQTHPDLAANVITGYGWDWNGNDHDPSPGPGDRHGTPCAGLAAARGNNSLGVSGAAPEATLAGMRLIAAPSTDEQEAEAMVWKSDLIHIKNNSWGPSDTGKLLEGPGPLTSAALEFATTTGRSGLGTIFVWAAGNGHAFGDNSNYDGYANSIFTIATAAIDSTGNATDYSEAGANIVVCAPSDGPPPALGITTTDLTGNAGYSAGDYTSIFGGTSAAAPLVSGVVALMLEKNPQLGWRDVQEILIHSATKVRPADSGWSTNGAGQHFHHRFGAGLVNATAAVAMADGWENLPPGESVSLIAGSAHAIPENQEAGVTVSFPITTNDLRVEHVTLTADISHTARGNLEITLTSPAGTISRLAEVHNDTNDDFANWTFSSVRHWGESPEGEWTLRVADRSPAGNTVGGTLQSATLRIFGSSTVPRNPPPAVAIISPADGTIVSPGAVVEVVVSASDLTADGTAGEIADVVLFDDGVEIASRSEAPFVFSVALANGPHVLVARATDTEGAAADSAPVLVSVENRSPVITSVSLNAIGQAYADQDLRVLTVAATDPDGTDPIVSYQWQSSADAITWLDAPGETDAKLVAAPPRAGRLWRCWVIASDSESTGAPFVSAAVNVLKRPLLSAVSGEFYEYASGLVVAGTPYTPQRAAIVHEFSQGPSGGNSEWLEILVLRDSDLRYWDVADTTNTLVFKDSPMWATIPAGTLIVVYNGNTVKDPALPADDPDPTDGRMVVSSTDPEFFDPAFDSWIPLANNGDTISLHDAASGLVHSLAYGNASGTVLQLPAVGSGTSARFSGDTENAVDDPAAWLITPADGDVTPGTPNTPTNAGFVASLRNGVPVIPARFSVVAGMTLPTGLTLDPISGVLSGTVSAPPGDYEIRIQRTVENGPSVEQAFILTVDSAGGYDAWMAGLSGQSDPPYFVVDDLPLLVRYALGVAANSSDHSIQFSSNATAVVLDFTRSKLHADAEIIPEWATSLESAADWESTGIHLELASETADLQYLRAILPIDSAVPRRFLRLKAVRCP